MSRRRCGYDRPLGRDKKPNGFHAYRFTCPICGYELRVGRDDEHKDCRKEIERRIAAGEESCQRS